MSRLREFAAATIASLHPLRRPMLVIVGAWVAFGIVQATISLGLAGAPSSEWGVTTLFHVLLALYWAAMTFFLIAARRAWRRRWRSSVVRAGAHVPLLIAAVMLHAVARRAAVQWLGNPASLPPFANTALYFADLAVVSYVVIVIVARVLEAHEALLARERRALALREQLTRAQIDFLEGQLQPHFLFNALSTIAELAHEAPAAAVVMLRDLSRLLRSAVAGRGRETITLGEELELLEPYLGIQRVRFEDWLRIEQFVEDSAREALVPRLVLQPLVENAVRHGLVGRSSPGRITIRAVTRGNALELSVEDDGVGLRPGASAAPGHGAGLRNVRERLRAVHGEAATLELRQGPHGGAVARIAIPLVLESAGVAASRVPASDARAMDHTDDQPSVAARSIPEWMAIAGIWSLAALFWIQQSIAYTILRGRLGQVSLLEAAWYDTAAALTWALATPLVLRLARLFPIVRFRLATSLAAHAALGALFVFGVTAVARVIGGGDDQPIFATMYTNTYISNAAIYAIIVCVAHTRQLRDWVRERELATSRLQAVLQASRLQHLTAELRPGVVLATLDHLAHVALIDPRRTERIVARLGALLRATLDGMAQPRLSLTSELHALHAYADVLGAAVAPGLQLVVTDEDPHGDIDIPSGLLRSLFDELLELWRPTPEIVRLTIAVNDAELTIHATAGARALHVSRDDELPLSPRLAELLREGALLEASVSSDHARFILPLERTLANASAHEHTSHFAFT